MDQSTYTAIIRDQTQRALWEIRNVIACVPDAMWDELYCGMPVWKHAYHTLHSLDLWYINPSDPQYEEPPFHAPGLNDLDAEPQGRLTCDQLNAYSDAIERKIAAYLGGLDDASLLSNPQDSAYTRFTLILAQHRHLHTHMGMLMGFIIAETGQWPRVIGLQGVIPEGGYGEFA